MLSQTDHWLSLSAVAGWDISLVEAADAALAAHTPPIARMSAIRSLLSERAGMNVCRRGWPADVLGWLLAARRPFAWALLQLTGEIPRVEPIDGSEAERRLSETEATALGVVDEDSLWCWERRGLLRVGTTIAAEVQLRVVPARIGGWDGEEVALLKKGLPCDEVVPGLVRADRQGKVSWPADPAVLGAAVLRTATGTAFGFTEERVTAGLVSRLAEV